MNLWPFRNKQNWLRADHRRTLLNLLAREDSQHTQEPSVEKQQIERRVDRDLIITIGTVSVVAIGTLGFPIIRLLSLPGIFYGFWPIYKEAYQTSIKERKVDLSILYLFIQSMELFFGLFFATALGNVWFLMSQKLMVVAKERYRQSLHHMLEQLPTTVYV